MVPLAMCYCGFFLSFLSGYQCEKKDHAFSSGFSRKMKSGWKAKIMVLFLALTNIPLAIYTSTVHQKGTTDVMEYIQIESSKLRSANDMSVLFLMPCHSTPFYRYSTVFNFDGCSCETVFSFFCTCICFPFLLYLTTPFQALVQGR